MSGRRALFLFAPPVFAVALAWGLIGESSAWWQPVLGGLALLAGIAWAAVVAAYLNRPVEQVDEHHR